VTAAACNDHRCHAKAQRILDKTGNPHARLLKPNGLAVTLVRRAVALSQRSERLRVLSEHAPSFGAISRLNHASSRCPRCSRSQQRFRRLVRLAPPRALVMSLEATQQLEDRCHGNSYGRCR
jgi:hypothetical protein